MDKDQFINKLPKSYSAAERELIQKAYAFAEEAHAGQTRANGLPYFTHCLGVANILLELEASPNIVAAGLLHDVLMDTPVTIETLRKEFGRTITGFVEDVTRITALPQLSRADQHPPERTPLAPSTPLSELKLSDDLAETLRKMLLAIGEDIRVVVIKMADRLYNMRTLSSLPLDRQRIIGQETLDVFAPLANRLGIWQFKWELEDLGFRYTNPEKYKEIADQLTLRRAKRLEEIEKIVANLQDLCEKADVKASISGRPKHIYSIYRKMQGKSKNFDSIRDLRAVRAIVDDVETCYKVLGIIHMHFQPIPGEFDDYIAAKKPNNYQSLHTSVIYTDGKPLEVQIRTWEMHHNAEFGIAAHWRYKESSAALSVDYENKVQSMRNLLAWSQEVDDNQSLIEGMKSDVFHDRVYVLTPKNDVVDLPEGSTPIDFAYQVHTDIGHRCRGARVNGKLVTLDYTLHTGDLVEILTVNRGGPSRDWLNPSLGLVKSSRSRAKIKQWFKQQAREQNLEHGRLLIEKEFKRLGLTDINLNDYAASFNVRTVDDLYVGIGTGDIPMGRLITRIEELSKPSLAELDELIPEAPRSSGDSAAITVSGLSGMATNFARCCNPMPGDEVIGYITRGRGVTIHRSDCPNVLRVSDTERLIRVDWGRATQTFPVPLQVTSYDRQGLMADISAVLSSEPARLVNLSLSSKQHIMKIYLIVEIADISELSRLLARLENIPNVIEAIRVRPG